MRFACGIREKMFEKTIEILRAKLIELDLLKAVHNSEGFLKYKKEVEAEINEAITVLRLQEKITKGGD